MNTMETPANLDLEKEIDKTVNECTDGYNFDWDKFAQHFYELGRNSKPAEWSEEDVRHLYNIIFAVNNTYKNNMEQKVQLIAWLKSLKNRGNFPKSNTNSPSWKPSEEQIKKSLTKSIRYDTV